MSRSRTPFLSGTILNNPLAIGGTSLSSAGLASLPAIASPDIAVLVLDPAGSGGVPEVVWVTAHTASATTATITRGAEGTTARAHNLNVPWIHAPTTYDFPYSQGADVASAATLVPDPKSDFVHVTGTTTVNFITSRQSGQTLSVYISTTSNSVTFTHQSTTGDGHIYIPGGYSLAAYPGELLTFICDWNGSVHRWVLVSRSAGPPVLAGSSSNELTTTSLTAVDLLTISGLSIPLDLPVRVTGMCRKTAGAAAAVGFGFKVNGGDVLPAFVGASSSVHLWASSASNQPENGSFELHIGPRRTNYTSSWHGVYQSPSNGPSLIGGSGNVVGSTINSFTVTALSGSASVTAAVRDVRIYAG